MTAAENGDPGGDTGLGWDAALAGRLHSSIREVFPPVPFKDVAAAIVLDPRFPEPRRIVDMVQGRCWTDLSAAELMLIRSIGLWVTDEAFVALIPAFMDAALADGLPASQACELRAVAVVDLSPASPQLDGALERRRELLTPAQLEFICDWLQVQTYPPPSAVALRFWTEAREASKRSALGAK